MGRNLHSPCSCSCSCFGSRPSMRLNSDQTVAVSTDYYWTEDMSSCPRNAKVQLLGQGGVAVYGEYHGEPFWVSWAPCPRVKKSVFPIAAATAVSIPPA